MTGAPGAGKSAVLARVVTTADPAFRASMPEGDTGVMAGAGSVSCAVHAAGKTALEVAAEIAAAARARPPAEPGDLAGALREVLPAPGRFCVVIDAIDEAASPAEARAVIKSVVLPLAENISDAGVRVAVGTRRRDNGGDLLDRFGDGAELVDLDGPEYFLEGDLADYALACLQLAGDERPGSPYADAAAARPLAAAIARAAEKNFLIAGLAARAHGMHDTVSADPARLKPVSSVRDALDGYLEHLAGTRGIPARQLLTALAFAEAPGLTAGLWQLVVGALPPAAGDVQPAQVAAGELAMFARSGAANFLVETGGDDRAPGGSGGRSCRLFHQALSDALLQARAEFADRAEDERAIASAFTASGREAGWDSAPAYLLRSLPGHAAAAGTVGALLADDGYLLHADLHRLLRAVAGESSPESARRVRLLRLTPWAAVARPGRAHGHVQRHRDHRRTR